ncbi:serine hydrolase [Spirillospora sp. NBC_01491]|uniref:serine hydrolase n=1 Tax=Spirillospora sp. NBC_01491 TaxID=2976007 RepID=UPI002E379BC6|nr:serine hydrolase [Spirillospora sp. NBC_01491]
MRDELDELARRAAGWGGALGVVAHDLGSGERVAVGAGRAFTAASVIKLPIMMTLLSGAEAGRWSLDDRLPLGPEASVGGSGIVKDLVDVPDLSVRDLLTLMIVLSDNTATNLLIDLVGLDGVAAWCARNGLRGTVPARRMLDAAARARGEENLTTPDDVAALLAGLARGELLDGPSTALALDVLARQQTNDRLPRHLPAGARLAHKTGELVGVRHDAGIVLAEGRAPLVVVALTEAAGPAGAAADAGAGGPASAEVEERAADLIAEVGRVVYTATGLI